LAAEHSIADEDHIFGLSVSECSFKKDQTQQSAKAGDLIFLTKNMAVGILATALKQTENYR